MKGLLIGLVTTYRSGKADSFLKGAQNQEDDLLYH